LKRLGIDCDGVVFDFVGAFYKIANPMFGTNHSGPQLTWDFVDEYSPAQVDAVWTEIKNTKDFWQTLLPMPGTSSLRFANSLWDGRRLDVEPVFITSRVPTTGHSAREQTCAALRQWFFITFPNVIVVDNPAQKIPICKALEIDNFIDDKRSTILQMHNAGLRSYAKLAPYNSSEPFPEGVIPVETLDEYLEEELKIG
jgi:hypothetical protein